MEIKVKWNRLSWCTEDSYWCPHAFMYLCRHAETSAIASNIVNELFWFSTSTQASLYISAVYSQSGFKSLLSDHTLLPTRVKQNVRIKVLVNDALNILETRNDPTGNYMFKVNNRNTRRRYETCSKLTIKTPQRCLAWFWCLHC